MGLSQQHYKNWSTFQHILEFAFTLKGDIQTAFLIMLSALCWTIWKIRNELCFQQVPKKTFKTIVMLIISLISYWSGNVKRQVKDLLALWLPEDPDVIPLQTWELREEDLLTTPLLLLRRGRAAHHSLYYLLCFSYGCHLLYCVFVLDICCMLVL